MAVDKIRNYHVVNNNNSIQVHQPIFGTKNSNVPEEISNSFENDFEVKASTTKKVGLGVASYLLPGLGQIINGEIGKGLAFFGASILASIGYTIAKAGTLKCTGKEVVNMFSPETRNLKFDMRMPKIEHVKNKAGIVVFGLAYLGSKIWAIVDAVRKAKPDIETK